MAQGKRNLGGLPAWDALDSLVARLRRGESLERCLEEYAGLADELRPLAYVVGELEEARPRPAAPRPEGLARGRERLLAAAAQERVATELAAALAPAYPVAAVPALVLARIRERFLAAAAVEEARLAEAVDGALFGAAAAASVPAETSLAGARLELDGSHLESVISLAAALQPARPVPAAVAPPLARARERFLQAAAAQQQGAGAPDAASELVASSATPVAAPAPDAADSRAFAEPVSRQARARRDAAAGTKRGSSPAAAGGFGAWLGRAFGSPIRFRPAELAFAAMAMSLFIMFSFSPVAAESLPGDMLYPVKRFGEQVRLITKVLSPDRYRAVAADMEAERLREVDRLVQQGREAEVSLRGRLAGFYEKTTPGEKPHGELSLAVERSGESPETRTVAWDTETSFDAGPYGQFSSVPRGAVVQVTMKTNSEGHPLVARKVSVREAANEATATITATATLTVTIETPAAPAVTVTPTATHEALPIVPSATLTITPSRATATAAITEVLDATPTLETERPKNEARLLGVVLAMPDPTTWRLRRLRDAEKSEITADLSQLANDKRLSEVQVGYQVELVGRWKSRAGNGGTFLATALKSVKPANCQVSREEFLVTGVERDESGNVVSLTLANGATYSVGSQVAASTMRQVAVGDTVAVTVQTCPHLDAPQITALDVTGKANERPRQTLQGVVSQLDTDQRHFVLIADAGAGAAGARTVTFDAATVIKGASGRLRDGQLVTVVAVETATGELQALTITILAEPRPTPTPSPTTGATPVPTVQADAPPPTKAADPPLPPTPTPAGSSSSMRVSEATR